MAIHANTYGKLFAKTLVMEAEYRKKATANVYPITDVDGVKQKGESITISGLTNVSWSAITDPFSTTATEITTTPVVVTLDQDFEINKGISRKSIAQVPPELVQSTAKNAASEKVKMQDAYVYSLYAGAGTTINGGGSPATVTKDNILGYILDAKTALANVNVDDMDMILEVDPEVDALIVTAMQSLGMPNTVAEDGKTPTVYGVKKIVSSQIAVSSTSHKCLLRTARSMAFYEQISDIKIVDGTESGTAHGTKVFGECLYGAAVAVPSELVLINCKLS